jgi:23S rRNA (cytosine1962-C5)-methyltransferase
MRRVTLAPARAKPLWWGHPWVRDDAIADAGEGDDDWVEVVDAAGGAVGRGWWSPRSRIRVRLVDRAREPRDEQEVIAERIDAAVSLRRSLFPDASRTDAYRLVHAEGDGLPGLVVDRYGPVLVAQFATRPLVRRREALARRLLEATGATSLLARAGGREDEEGIPPSEVAFAAGEPVPETVEVREEGVRLRLDLARGQKTGHYVDQRENRGFVAERAAGKTVLDLYAGTGGFSLRALLAGAASARAVDSSGPALETARANAALNGVDGRLETVEEDAEAHLSALARARSAFDVVVVDPPRFAATRAGLGKALAAYRRVNARGLARVAPGGTFATFSCSGLVTPEDFAEVVRSAARECRRTASVLRTLSAGPDHPVDLAAPEGRYLTGLLLAVRA